MKARWPRAIVLPLLLLAAHGAVGGELSAGAAWARPTPPGVSVAAVYLRIDNSGGRADRLLAITSSAAIRAEVHRTSIVDGIARMRPVPVLHVGADEVIEFAPGGLHIMLMGLGQPLTAGQTFTLELVFELAGTRRVTVSVTRPVPDARSRTAA